MIQIKNNEKAKMTNNDKNGKNGHPKLPLMTKYV